MRQEGTGLTARDAHIVGHSRYSIITKPAGHEKFDEVKRMGCAIKSDVRSSPISPPTQVFVRVEAEAFTIATMPAADGLGQLANV